MARELGGGERGGEGGLRGGGWERVGWGRKLRRCSERYQGFTVRLRASGEEGGGVMLKLHLVERRGWEGARRARMAQRER